MISATSTSEHSGRDDTVLVGLLEDALRGRLRAVRPRHEQSAVDERRGRSEGAGRHGGADHRCARHRHRRPASIARPKPWWRNRAYTTAMGTAVAGTPALGCLGRRSDHVATTNGGALITLLQNEYRQLTRYGGKPNTAFCGSSWLSALETELRANGNYSMQGFAGGKDVSVGKISYMGTDFEYDPTLDALGKQKRCYWYDSRDIYLVAMQDEWRHQHSPDRPPDKYVIYRSITSTGQLCARRLNSAVVIDIA